MKSKFSKLSLYYGWGWYRLVAADDSVQHAPNDMLGHAEFMAPCKIAHSGTDEHGYRFGTRDSALHALQIIESHMKERS